MQINLETCYMFVVAIGPTALKYCKRYRGEFSKQFEGYFVSVLLMHVCVTKINNWANKIR